MSIKVSFEGIGEVVATFRCDEGVKAGMPVKLDATGKALPCGNGEGFVGVAYTDAKEGCASIQVGGFATAAVSGEGVTCGYVGLVADEAGGVKKASGSEGRQCLVAAVENGVATFKM